MGYCTVFVPVVLRKVKLAESWKQIHYAADRLPASAANLYRVIGLIPRAQPKGNLGGQAPPIEMLLDCSKVKLIRNSSLLLH